MNKTICTTLCLLVAGCSDEADRTSCFEDRDVVVEIQVAPNNFDNVRTEGPVTITGSVDANIRLATLRVGGVAARGDADNFATWTAELTAQQMEASRMGDTAVLEVIGRDVCGTEHTADPVDVKTRAPEGTPATGLVVRAVATQTNSDGEPECYLPADASSQARVLVAAESAAAGVPVTLSSGVDGDLLGADEGVVVLEDGGGEACTTLLDATSCATTPDVLFRPTKPGLVRIAATAASTFTLDDSGLRAVGAPEFTGTSAEVPPETPVRVFVETDGRLRSCLASTARPELVSVDAGGVELTETPAGYDLADCDQREAFDVQFLAGVTEGLTVEIECTDTYGQTGAVTLSAGAAEAIEPEPK